MALLMALTILMSYICIPIALYKHFTGTLECGALSLIPTVLGGGLLTIGILFPILGKTKGLFSFILFTPLSMLSVILAVLSTLFTNKIDWSGYRYTVDPRDGRVTNIEQI